MSEQQRQLYNRQEYVVGAEAQRKYGVTDALIVGLGGLGCEIAKNLVLTGLRSVAILDDAPITSGDLSSLFYAGTDDIGKPRAATVVPKVAELNRFVNVRHLTGSVTEELIKQFTVVIFTDGLTTQLVQENRWARANGVHFVACENRGITGSIFVDGGNEFTIMDKNGEETVSAIVTGMTDDGVIMCHEDKKHECEIGDKVYFTGIQGPDVNSVGDSLRLFEVTDVIGPFILKVNGQGSLDNASKTFVAKGGYMHTTKQNVKTTFASLEDSMKSPEMMFIDDDFSKLTAGPQLHLLFTKIHEFVARNGRLPIDGDVDGISSAAMAEDKELDETFAKDVVRTFRGNLNAMACLVGGLASQEALKLCSNKFTPLKQWMYYDVREILKGAGNDTAPTGSRYDGQIAVIGKQAQEAIQKKSAFIVGAGALGCEFVKNFACMGVATNGGTLHITDMDTIELSNLSRQFLFRTEHIGQPKSRIAGAAALKINPSLSILAKEEKVAAETSATFNGDFWESVDFVCNALDNVLARKYVDEQCVFYKKPLFESGTLGTKCNVQVVVPYLTESYSSSYDPPDKTVPICTLKNFPNAIEHTIQWAREAFLSNFMGTCRDVNSYLRDDSFLPSLDKEPGNKPLVFASLIAAINGAPKSFEDCISWARTKFDEMFTNNVKQLLHNLPLDKVGENGQLFWSGAKKPPTPAAFDPENADHRDFIIASSRLFAETYGLLPNMDGDAIMAFAATISPPPFRPKVAKFAESENDKSDNAEAQLVGEITANDLPSREANAKMVMKEIEFEKDDDHNGHIDFITATSNIRAASYAIPTADKFRTKGIAGNIIPAMVTTTSLVTGLVGFEMIKYLLGAQSIEDYHNAYVNIALPLITFTTPIAAPGASHKKKDGSEVTWTMWDRIDIDEGEDITIRRLVEILEAKYDIETSMITAEGGKILYSEFNQKPEKVNAKVSDAVQKLLGSQLSSEVRHLCMVVTGCIADEDVDIPMVRYKFRF